MPSDSITAGLKRAILDGLACTAPHHDSQTGSGLIFTGSFDWHSSVHAHWALLSLARLSNDATLQKKMLRRLSPRKLEAERAFLLDEANHDFETPYGRAWLLLLLAELEKHEPAHPESLALFQREIGEQVALWLEENLTDREALLCGSHGSWLFAFLLAQFSAPGAAVQERLDALRPRIESERGAIEALAHAPSRGWDSHLPAVLFLIDRTRSQHSTYTEISEEAPALRFDDELRFDNCHQAGANAVRLWPHALDRGSGRFREGLQQIVSRPEQWRGDFRMVSHWVPQFLWLGLMLERGELIPME